MKPQSKLFQKQEAIGEQLSEQLPAQEFVNPDELLRFDAAQIGVPPGIGLRLQKSAAQINPPESRGWWSKLFGG